MAHVQRDPSGNFHICFRFGGHRFKRSLHTKHQRKADASASHVASNIRIGSLFGEFKARTPEGALEATSLRTFKTHMGHVTRLLGSNTNLRSIRTSDLQRYVTARSGEQGRRGKVSPVTIRKELATLGSLWNWARTFDFVSSDFPRRGLVFGKHEDKPSFQTWSQIERQIERDGLNEYEAEPLWESLYLDATEIANRELSARKKRATVSIACSRERNAKRIDLFVAVTAGLNIAVNLKLLLQRLASEFRCFHGEIGNIRGGGGGGSLSRRSRSHTPPFAEGVREQSRSKQPRLSTEGQNPKPRRRESWRPQGR